MFIGHENDYIEDNRRGGGFSGDSELEEVNASLEREHATPAEMMLSAYRNTEPNDVSFRSRERFLHHVRQTFEENKLNGNKGLAMDKKMNVREEVREKEMGIQRVANKLIT